MKISSIISDGMILQRDVENTLSGFRDGSETITALWDGEPIPVNIRRENCWSLLLPPHPAGGPHTLKISSEKDTITIRDILFGDVYILGGQSNMELPTIWTTDYHYDEIISADYPMIRQFEVPKIPLFGKKAEMLTGGSWVNCDQEHIFGFSAIGFYFAKYKFLSDGIPVGLIQTAVGGAPVESLMSEENLISTYEMIAATDHGSGYCNNDKSKACLWCYKEKLSQNRNEDFVSGTQAEDMKRQDAWHKDLDKRDPGLSGGWEDKWPETEEYSSFDMPSTFMGTPYEDYKGSIWLQKTIAVPASWLEDTVELRLGTLIDSDTTFVNGQKVGEYGFKYPPRRYFLKPGILHEGENTITVRLGIDGNIGGAVPECPYCLKRNEEEISLEGRWKMREGARSEALTGPTFFNWAPTALYNSMIYPLSGTRCRAMLFYQGESNCEYPQHYADLLKNMVAEWRECFGRETPFYMAEVTYWLGDGPVYESDPFDAVREVQRSVVHEIPGCFLIPTYDLGQHNDLHPHKKKEVALRFLEQYQNNENA
ncbi:MAG: hypothetical protein IK020_01340 [Clostridiales bacterium]|nr:hypothetical protein [Clostridiales bacterium]